MFNIFKSQFPRETKEFAATFTKEQKVAIIGSQNIIVNSQDYKHSNEDIHVKNVARLLHFSFKDPELSKYLNYTINDLKPILRFLSPSQKEWFAVSLHELVECSGITNFNKKIDALDLLESIGISEAKYNEVVKIAHLLKQRYS